MLEKDITPRVLQSIRDDDRFGSGLYEIKFSRGKTLKKGALAPHQYRNLKIAATGKMYFKIPDVGYQNPADAFILKKAEGWLVIWFQLTPRSHEVWAIPVDRLPIVDGVNGGITIGWAIENGIEVEC